MDLRFHLPTLSLATGLVALVLGGYMSHLQWARPTYPGFKHWTLASFLVALAMPLVSLRDVAPDWLSIVVANQLFLLFTILMIRGLALFAGRRPKKGQDIILSLLFLACALWWTYGEPNLNNRIISFSFIFFFYLLRCAKLVWFEVTAATGVRNLVLAGTFALVGIFFLARALVAIFTPQPAVSLMTFTPWQAVTFTVAFSSVPVTLFGLVFLNIQRMEKDLRAAQDEVKTLAGLLPICAQCKRIRDDGGYWHQVEEYITTRTEATFTHGICPQCMKQLYPEVSQEIEGKKQILT